MTAVTLNPAGGLSPAATGVVSGGTGTKEKSNDFGNLMMGKLGNRADSTANQTEVTFKDGTKTKISTPVKKNDFSAKSTKLEAEKSQSKIKDDKGNINAEEAAAALGVMNNIVEGVAKILGISEEELAGSMEALGMKPEDLLNQNSLTELVLYQNGSSDVSDMLVDNGMLETFNELRDFVNSVLDDAGLEANSFADMLSSKEFKAVASDLLKNQDDINKMLSDYYQGEDISFADTEAVQVELNGSDADGAELGSGSTEAKKADDGVEVKQVEINPESFIKNLENAAEIDEMAPIEQAQFREIAFQVVEQVRVNISPDTTSMEMQLNPENLGRVAINISSKAGIMTAEITTENQQAKEAIESQLQILKETIEAKGVRVEAIEVKVSEFSFADSKNAESDGDQYNQGQNSRNPRRGSFSALGEDEEVSEAAIAAREILQNAGSTVNYRA